MVQVYGIPNCNTVKKALDWLNANGIEYTFHNFKKEGVDEAVLLAVDKQMGWEILLNKKGTTWRTLEPMEQLQAEKKKGAFALMKEKPSIIKRPIIMATNAILIGFDETAYKQALL